MKTLIKDNGYVTYVIEQDKSKSLRYSFKVFEVNSWDGNSQPCHENNTIFIRGTILIDGYSHLFFGDNEGYLHFSENESDNIKTVLDAVNELAKKHFQDSHP